MPENKPPSSRTGPQHGGRSPASGRFEIEQTIDRAAKAIKDLAAQHVHIPASSRARGPGRPGYIAFNFEIGRTAPSNPIVNQLPQIGSHPKAKAALELALNYVRGSLLREGATFLQHPPEVIKNEPAFERTINNFLQQRREDAYAIGLYFNELDKSAKLGSTTQDAIALADKLADLISRTPSLKSEIISKSKLGSLFATASERLRTSKDPDFPFPLLPSDRVLSEEDRRAPGKMLWKHRRKSFANISPTDFIERIYKDRLGKGFTQADLKAADPGLYQALHQWLQKPNPVSGERNQIPAALDIPTLAEWNARRLLQLEVAPETISDEEKIRLAKVRMGRAVRSAAMKNKQH